MENEGDPQDNNLYLYSVIFLMLVFPLVSVVIDFWSSPQQTIWWVTVGKWFIFWAVGLRLLFAGIRQIVNPAFTAENIFHFKSKETHLIIQELGFANVCLGMLSVVSLFVSEWRTAAASAGGLFFGIAGINHIIKKPVSKNEVVALISDIFIFFVMLSYLFLCLKDKYH